MWLYNLGIHLYGGLVRVVSPFNGKARLWSRGRRGLFPKLAAELEGAANVVWVHAASLGEFEQGRPVIEAIRREHPGHRILLTFFSPSGYEIRKNYRGADWVFYLPSDTPRHARRFLDAVRPVAAIFIKYEFWLNYLAELHRRQVSAYVVSAIFRPDSIFFRRHGGRFRRALASFARVFVQDDASRELLAGIGITNVTVAGDTRFDRVAEIAAAAHPLPVIEEFLGGEAEVFVAGSTWPPDEELIARLAAENPDMKFIIAPHETGPERVARLMAKLPAGTARYTAWEPGNRGAQVLVIDTIGVLSSLYRYARYTYIGGGFGVGIHNTLEAATFGMPIVFGSNYQKFREARDLIALGAARSISDFRELTDWLDSLRRDDTLRLSASSSARNYVATHTGATQTILNGINLID